MAFKVSDYTASPSQELLDLVKDITDHYGIPNVKNTMLKHEINIILNHFFVEEELFDSLATSQILVTKNNK